jgi:hypothetical protein
MPRTKYRFHPACTVFPQLSDEELRELADDIATNGLRNPIVLWKGKILDGRNRYLACGMAGVEARFTEFDGDDPIGWVVSQNLLRRHLTASQKAVVALDLLPLLEKEAKQRQRQANAYRGNGRSAQKCAKRNGKGKAAELAAQIVGVGSRYVEMAKEIKSKAPELVEKVRSGEVNVAEASEIARLPARKRSQAIKKIENGQPANGSNGSYVFQAGDVRNRRPSNTTTPPGVCRFLHDIISEKYTVKTILDPCAGRGNLTRPWKGCKVIAFEATKGKDFFQCPDSIKSDLVLCNPPWSGGGKTAKSPVSMFLERILEVVPKRTPIVLIAHWSFRMDQDKKSSRWKWLRDECPPISSIITLPHDIWADAKVHSEILLFNMRKLRPHYFLPDEYLRR